ncbi:FprA family A-type flavoprotein [Bengtsoniella intestinalis]|uniref:FprA family A-type flavoprotein n=1 Tax=Bengtsoniella intestinalis TaxID=3073143 RepID=UPI00391FB0B3
MYCYGTVTPDLFWLGDSDRRLALFENAYPIPRGVSYNAYLVMDEKTILMDTVDRSVGEQFFENLEACLKGRNLDYVVINHMEPDHCATLIDVILRYPGVTVVGNAKTMTMIDQFFDFDMTGQSLIVKEGDTLCTGRHTFTFAMAPMVHWPEAMVTYDMSDKVLFSADAFGTFGALSGNLFADQMDFEHDWLSDARRYYTNIVGKYGPQVQALLKKAANLDIQYICPLHGPIWRENVEWYIDKYQKWSTYTPEVKSVLVIYGSVYGHTENAALVLAGALSRRGVTNIAVHDASVTHLSELVSLCFQYSHIVLASATYNNGIFTPMETLLSDMKAHNVQNRTVAIIENGSWAPQAAKLMRAELEHMKNIRLLEQSVTLKSSVKEAQRVALEELADALVADLQG